MATKTASEKGAKKSVKIKPVSSKVPVVDFVPHKRKAPYASFIKPGTTPTPDKNAPGAPPSVPSTAEDITSFSVSQLWDRMKTSVEELQVQDMDGKQRRRFLQSKLVHLGAKAPALPKAPAKILQGMRAKAVKRKQRVQEERDKTGGEHVKFASDDFKKVHVVNAAIFKKRPKEERLEKEKEARKIKFRNRPKQ